MKKTLLATLVVLGSIAGYAQCGKNIIWTSSKTEYLDSNGQVEDVKSLATIIQTTPGHITVTVNEGGGDIIQGEIKNLSCDWKEAYRNGRTHFESLMTKSNGEARQVRFTIEAMDGKIVIIVEVERMEGKKMRLLVDNYKEEA